MTEVLKFKPNPALPDDEVKALRAKMVEAYDREDWDTYIDAFIALVSESERERVLRYLLHQQGERLAKQATDLAAKWREFNQALLEGKRDQKENNAFASKEECQNLWGTTGEEITEEKLAQATRILDEACKWDQKEKNDE